MKPEYRNPDTEGKGCAQAETTTGMSKPSALVGTNFAEDCRKVGEALQKDFDANHEAWANEAAETARKQQEGRHEYYVVTSRTSNGMVKVVTIEAVPLIGRVGAVGRSLDAALVELRFACAYELAQQKFMTLPEARKYCLKFTFRLDASSPLIIAP